MKVPISNYSASHCADVQSYIVVVCFSFFHFPCLCDSLSLSGYRLMKVNLFLVGFAIGGLLTYFVLLAFMGNFTPSWKIYVTVAVTVLVAIVAGLLTICIYYIGMFLAGGSVGFLATWFILSVIDVPFFQTHIYVPILIAIAVGIVCGIVTLIFQKWLVIVGTSIIGGFFIMWSLDYYLELGQMIYYLFLFAVHRSALRLCWYSWCLLGLFPILALAGFILQVCVTGRKYDHKKDFDGKSLPFVGGVAISPLFCRDLLWVVQEVSQEEKRGFCQVHGGCNRRQLFYDVLSSLFPLAIEEHGLTKNALPHCNFVTMTGCMTANFTHH